MRFNPEYLKEISRRAVYAALMVQSALVGCQAPEERVQNYPGKPELTLYPEVRCDKNGSPKLSVRYEARGPIEGLVIRIIDQDSRLGFMHPVEPNNSLSGTVDFKGVNYNSNGQKTVVPLTPGQTVGVSAASVSEAREGSGTIVAAAPLTPLKSIKLDCRK
jgi:hypothetical protein